MIPESIVYRDINVNIVYISNIFNINLTSSDDDNAPIAVNRNLTPAAFPYVSGLIQSPVNGTENPEVINIL